MEIRIRRTIGLITLLVLGAQPARAQGTARSLDLDVSPTSAGMGGASGAVFWGDPNTWANPALLAYHDGLRWSHMREKLVPGLATDVSFTTDRYTAGAHGLALSVAGRSKLDYGASEIVDENGNPLGVFRAYETTSLWGIAVSAASMLDAITSTTRMPTHVARYADLAFGYTHKHTRIALSPQVASGDQSDIGLLARVTPIDRLRERAWPLRFDASYGDAVINRQDTQFDFGTETAPTSRIHHNAVAVRGAVGPALTPPTWWSAALTPLISVATAYDRESVAAGDGPVQYHVEHRGFEVALANIVWVRRGRYIDKVGGINGKTDGWGVGFQSEFGSFRYDQGKVPQANEANLPKVRRRGFTVVLQPLAIARALR